MPLSDAGKLGPVLWQLPENFHRDDDRLAEALEALPPARHCFEFRHESWFVSEVEELLRAHRAALVFADEPKRRFQTLTRTTDWTYLRFHGPDATAHAYQGRYGEERLSAIADRLDTWLGQGHDVYAYFNNDDSGFAVHDARWLAGRLAGGA